MEGQGDGEIEGQEGRGWWGRVCLSGMRQVGANWVLWGRVRQGSSSKVDDREENNKKKGYPCGMRCGPGPGCGFRWIHTTNTWTLNCRYGTILP